MAANWLNDAVFYEIYPQSFFDSNGDGIGDIQGIIEKLPYVKSLGCNAIWLNPIYDSPFKDGGYDVRDHKKVAERYGTEADAARLFEEAHRMGLKILLDLVPGHTSEEHPWFLQSAREEKNEMSDRYIWTDNAFCGGDGMPFIGGEWPRDAAYIINFFKCQPALNFGYRDIHASWQQPIDASGPMANREAMKDIMRHWLKLGCDGFRVDMADSLVKNDHGTKEATVKVWQDIAGAIHAEFPDAALVSEWNNPQQALAGGFDMDFFLNWDGNGYSNLLRDYKLDGSRLISDNSYFNRDSDRDISCFLGDYLPKYEQTKDMGLYCLITGNHDVKRPTVNLDDAERKIAYAFLLTMPGVPFIYYGDEIGMNYRFIPTKEGGYHRTGSRTPMQWDSSENHGFSKAAVERLYLPVDPAYDAPTVENQEADPDSMLNFVRKIIELRHAQKDLQAYSPFAVYYEGKRCFAYRRGDLLLAVNPGKEAEAVLLDGNYDLIFAHGAPALDAETLVLPGGSFAVLKPQK
jgi:maltose alpha-D-glucosyltransferase/alpha-amylase